MKPNTYGLVMRGLAKAAGETKALKNPHSSLRLQINYDKIAGEVFTIERYGCDDVSPPADDSITVVCLTDTPMNKREIADAIHRALE